VDADPSVADAAALIGEPARAAFLLALSEEEALPATSLAARAGVSASAASGHLAKLVAGGLVVAERRGRHRFYRLANPAVAGALEALAAISRPRAVRSLRESDRAQALRAARTCYDHLAGRLGVAVTEALVARDVMRAADGGYEVTAAGAQQLAELGIDLDALAGGRRPLTRACLDWSERRPHLGGALGRALLEGFLVRGWLRPAGSSRAVRVTDDGRAGFGALGVDVERL